MKKIIVILSVLILHVQNAQAKSYKPKPIEALKSRSAGGAFDETPATKIFEKEDWSIKFFEAEAVLPASQIIKVAKILNDVRNYIGDLKDVIKENPYMLFSQAEKFLELEEKIRFNSRLKSRGQVISTLYRSKNIRFSYGAYWEGDGQVVINPPNLRSITPVISYWTAYLDFHKKTDIVLIKTRWDAGTFLEYSKKFRIYKKVKLAIGNRIRFFHRWFIPGYRLHLDRRVMSTSNIHSPELNKKEGLGIGMDSFGALKLYDKIFDSLFSLRLEGFGWVEFNDNTTFYEIPHISFGAVFRPFHLLNINGLLLGIDFEDIAGIPAFQTGIRYNWEKKARIANYRFVLGVVPQAGVIIGEKDLFHIRSNSLTLGISSYMAIIEFGILYERNFTFKNHNFGINFGFLF